MQTNYNERLISAGVSSSQKKFYAVGRFPQRVAVRQRPVQERRVLCGRITAWFKFAGGASNSKKPLSSRSSFHFLFSLPFAGSDAELEFPFKVGQRPLSLPRFPHPLSTSLCLPGAVSYVIPIQSASLWKKRERERDGTRVLWFYLLCFKLISSFPLWPSSQSSPWCLLCSAYLPETALFLFPSLCPSDRLFSSLPSPRVIHHCHHAPLLSYWSYTSWSTPAYISQMAPSQWSQAV